MKQPPVLIAGIEAQLALAITGLISNVEAYGHTCVQAVEGNLGWPDKLDCYGVGRLSGTHSSMLTYGGTRLS